MKAYNSNARKTVIVKKVQHFAFFMTATSGNGGGIPFGEATLWRLREIRAGIANLNAEAPEVGAWIRVERRVTITEVAACVHCQARPQEWDRDCDGWHSTLVCDSDQCKQGRNIDNAGWVAGETPLWGPGHPEWDQVAEVTAMARELVAAFPDAEPSF